MVHYYSIYILDIEKNLLYIDYLLKNNLSNNELIILNDTYIYAYKIGKKFKEDFSFFYRFRSTEKKDVLIFCKGFIDGYISK
jgi:hypothetical protein